MPTLEELLSDAQVADDLEISFGDKGKFKMGDLRAADKSRKSKADSIEKDILAKQAAAQKLADEAAKLVEQLNADAIKRSAAPKDGGIDFDTDPIYGPLVTKKLKPLEDTLSKLNSTIDSIQKSQADIARIGLSDRYSNRWDRVPEDRRKGKKWQDYVKVAGEKKIYDEFGLPDPVEALNRELEPVEKDALTKQLADAQKKIDELTKAAAAPRMPRPGSAGAPPVTKGSNDKVYDSADSLINDAFNDPAIQELTGRA